MLLLYYICMHFTECEWLTLLGTYYTNANYHCVFPTQRHLIVLLLYIILCVGYYNYQTPIHCIRIMTSIHALTEQTILFKCILIYILCMLCTFHTIVSVFYSVNTDYCNANWILMAKTHKVVTCSYICMITTPQVVVGTRAQG